MNIKNKLKKLQKNNVFNDNLGTYLRNFNIYYQFLCAQEQFLMLNAYSKINKVKKLKRSKNELEKPFNKL